jgi:ABC-type amino acid transport substrate-binding protein
MDIRWKKIVPSAVLIVFIMGGSIWGLNKVLSISMANIPTNQEIVNEFQLISKPVAYTITTPKRNPNWLRSSENILGRMKRRGILRVGYYENSMPFVFENDSGNLVGFDIDMAHQLARDLDVSLEFVPITTGKLIPWLKADYYDIVMSDVFLSSEYAKEIMLSKSYMEVSLALLTKNEFNSFNSFQEAIALDTFTLGYFVRKEIAQDFISYFPKGGIVGMDSYDSLFSDSYTDSLKMDALLTSAERASAWTVFHPDYKVVNPLPYHMYNSLVFPLATDEVWREYVNRWIDYREKDGTIQRMYDQWILGKEYRQSTASWSVWDAYIQPVDSVK